MCLVSIDLIGLNIGGNCNGRHCLGNECSYGIQTLNYQSAESRMHKAPLRLRWRSNETDTCVKSARPRLPEIESQIGLSPE
jgi:hypothetical protein